MSANPMKYISSKNKTRDIKKNQQSQNQEIHGSHPRHGQHIQFVVECYFVGGKLTGMIMSFSSFPQLRRICPVSLSKLFQNITPRRISSKIYMAK